MKFFMKLDRFLETDIYIYVIALLSFLGWQFHIEAFILFIYALFLVFIFLYRKDTSPFIPIAFSSCFIVNEWITMDYFPWWIIVLAVIIVGLIVFYIIKNKVKFTKGALVLSMGAISLSVVLSIFGASSEIPFSYRFISLCCIGYLLVYLFFRNTIKKDIFSYASKSLLAVGILIATQVFSFAIGDFFYCRELGQAMDWQRPILGWGISNDAAIYMNMAMGIGFYFVCKSHKPLLNLIPIIYMFIALLLTQSRGGIASFAVTIIPFIACVLRFNKNRKGLLIGGGIALVFLVGAVVVFYDGIMSMVNRMLEIGFDDNGRRELYDIAISCFKNQPIIGSSLFAAVDRNNRLIVFHSIFFQAIASFGIIGCIALVFHLFQSSKYIVKNRCLESLFFGIMLITSFLHGLIDNVFYMVIFMLIYLVMYVAFETHIEEKKS